MEGRCEVETWTEFGVLATLNTSKVKHGIGTNVLIYSDSSEVYIYNTHERNITVILQFPGPVRDVVVCHDTQLIFIACQRGVYSVDLKCLPPWSDGSASSCPPVVKISSDFLVIGTFEVSSMFHTGTMLLVLCRKYEFWVLTLYKNQQKSSAFEELASFSLPVVISESELTRTPVLVCVHFGDKTQSTHDATSACGHFQLEPVLFKLLFGVESVLVKSPVILCGLPDGRLCFLSLRVPVPQLKVFYSLEQPVVFVGASGVAGTNRGPAQCLVAVGEQGRMLLIKAAKGERETAGISAGFTEGFAFGPVKCVCVDKNSVYYSTGSDLFQLHLKLSEESAGRHDASGTMAAIFQSPISLNVCRVIAMDGPTYNAAGETQLLSLSATGQLQKIIPPVRSQDEEIATVPYSRFGHNMKDLLSAIGDVCDRASILEATIKSKNQVLVKLNQVVHISLLLSAEKDQKPIRCHGTVRWNKQIQKDSLELLCVLENSSPYILERGWTLCVTASPLSRSSAANFSFSFCDLHPNQTLEVCLPVGAAGETAFPLTVNCTLVFSLFALLGEEERSAFPHQRSKCFSLPLNTLTVDWLHALRLVAPASDRRRVASQSGGLAGARAFLQSRNRGAKERGESSSTPENYSASVCVLSELLTNGFQQPQLAHLGLATIAWLLSESAGGVRIAPTGDEANSSVVLARCPNEAEVKLTAKEMFVVEDGADQRTLCSFVDVQIESSSVAAVCGLHHALLCRVQTLLQRTADKADATQKVQNLALNRALQRAKIQRSEISRAFSAEMSTAQMNRLLLGVYQELRRNPLFIM